MRIVFSRSAETDLEAIGDYIAQDNARRAVSFVREIRERCEDLSAFPKRSPLVALRVVRGPQARA
ncbi:MAG TPA: type II toxin-antitoxin system RelE/ParE family toxin [Rhizobiaceae bacterium]|nr:type II toxin-antitoxin system RelE/ParE family toxin [Rhizobiaceae bacterium]